MMRRLSTAAAVTVVAMMLLMPSAGAQSPAPSSLPAPSSSVWVTAGDVCSATKPGTDVVVGDIEQIRDGELICNFSADDPRVNGRGPGTYNRDCSPVGCVFWGTVTIHGPDGDWVGSFNGVIDPNSDSYGYRILTGTGAYSGWSYVSHSVALASSTGGTFSGMIYEAPPPPWGPTPSAVPEPSPSPAG